MNVYEKNPLLRSKVRILQLNMEVAEMLYEIRRIEIVADETQKHTRPIEKELVRDIKKELSRIIEKTMASTRESSHAVNALKRRMFQVVGALPEGD